jgi:hypothetical protein
VRSSSWPFDFSLQLLLPFLYAGCYGAWACARLGLAAATQKNANGREHYDEVKRTLRNDLIAQPLKFLNVVRVSQHGASCSHKKVEIDRIEAAVHIVLVGVLGRLGDIEESAQCFVQVYLTAARYSTSVFRCTELEDGQSVLWVYPGMICGSPEHGWYVAFGAVGTLVYMVGYPLLVGVALWRINGKNLRTNTDCIATFGWVRSATRVSLRAHLVSSRLISSLLVGIRTVRSEVILLRPSDYPSVRLARAP